MCVWTKLQVIPQEFRSTDSHVVAPGTIVGERDGEYVDGDVAWAWKLRDGNEEPGEALEDTGIQ